MTIPAAVAREDARELCARVQHALIRSRADLVVCDVHELEDPGPAAVDVVLRLSMVARRRGCRFALRRPPPALLQMLELGGFCAVVDVSGVGVVGQPEQREEPGSIEERRDPDDPAV